MPPPPPELFYVCGSDRLVKGPFSLAQIKNLLSQHTITPETLCCKQGDENWISVETVIAPTANLPPCGVKEDVAAPEVCAMEISQKSEPESQPQKPKRIYGIINRDSQGRGFMVPWEMLSSDDKIFCIMEDNKLSQQLVEKIRKKGEPASFDDSWWEQNVLSALPEDDAMDIKFLLGLQREAAQGFPNMPPSMKATIQRAGQDALQEMARKMYGEDWDNRSGLIARLALYRSMGIAPAGVAKIVENRINELSLGTKILSWLKKR